MPFALLAILLTLQRRCSKGRQGCQYRARRKYAQVANSSWKPPSKLSPPGSIHAVGPDPSSTPALLLAAMVGIATPEAQSHSACDAYYDDVVLATVP
jgi:hypothetical protein